MKAASECDPCTLPAPSRELEMIWAADPFLTAGGHERRARRPLQGYSEYFAGLHGAV